MGTYCLKRSMNAGAIFVAPVKIGMSTPASARLRITMPNGAPVADTKIACAPLNFTALTCAAMLMSATLKSCFVVVTIERLSGSASAASIAFSLSWPDTSLVRRKATFVQLRPRM